MRKCQTCGYLVLGDGDECKHCGAPLPRAVASPVAAPALVPSAAPPAVPMAVPPVLPSFARAEPPGAARPPPTPVERDYWTPPTSSAPPTPARRSPRALLALIVIVSMALGWVAVEHRHDPLPPGTSAFVAGQGVAYSSPDHTFDARFPATPTVESRVIPLSTSSATVNLAQSQTNDYEILAASMVLPQPVPADRLEAVLREVFNEIATAHSDKITKQTSVNRYGVPGIEVRAKVSDGYDARFIVLISGTRIYLLGVHAKLGTDRLYDALLGSLIMY